jgi:hypothetical protein
MRRSRCWRAVVGAAGRCGARRFAGSRCVTPSHQLKLDDGGAKGLTSIERGEPRRPRRELRVVTEERDIL